MLQTKMCRICLKENDRDEQTLHIFDAHGASGELIGSLLIDCTDIDVSMEDNKPNIICMICYRELMRWFDFREMAKKSDIYLSKMVPKSKRGKKSKLMPSMPIAAVANEPVAVFLVEEKASAVDKSKINHPNALNIVKIEVNESEKRAEEVPKPPIINVKKGGIESTLCGVQIKRVTTVEKVSKRYTRSRKEEEHKPDVDNEIAPLVNIKKIKVETVELSDDNAALISELKNEIVDQEAIQDDESVSADVDSTNDCLPNLSKQQNSKCREPDNEICCCMCIERFVERKDLMNHTQSQHFDQIAKAKKKNTKSTFLFKCEYCWTKFLTYRDLQNHQRRYRTAKPCDICGIKVPAFKAHMHRKMHELKKSFTDAACSSPPHAEVRQLPCCMCIETFEDANVLERHAAEGHTQEIEKVMQKSQCSPEPFQCTICTMRLPTLAKLNIHTNRYQNVSQCVQCGEFVPTFKRSRHNRAHIDITVRQAALKRQNNHQCDICKKFCQSYAAIKIHMEIHNTEIRLECPIEGCDAVRVTERALKFHLKQHRVMAQGKTLECPMCSRMFYACDKSKLRMHMRIHTGENPFQCSYCEKKFIDRTDWHRHEWMHTGNSPYRCSKCDQMFTRKKTLVNHEAVCSQKRQKKS